MTTLLYALMIATVAVLVVGVVLMGSGGKANKKYGNKLMMARVILQGLAIALLFIMFLMFSK